MINIIAEARTVIYKLNVQVVAHRISVVDARVAPFVMLAMPDLVKFAKDYEMKGRRNIT